jgi:UDP-N-acetylmuramyl pentapeptide synthase
MNRLQHHIKELGSYYDPAYLGSQVYLLQDSGYRVFRYLKWFWSAQSFSGWNKLRPLKTPRNRALLLFVYLGTILQMLIAVAVLTGGMLYDAAGAVPIGLALLLSYPIVWPHMLALAYIAYKVVWTLVHPKAAGRATVCRVLEWQVVRLRAKHTFTIIAVAGSIGKTSTKLAIAHTLEPTRRVIYQTGNYNDRVTIPLVLFGQKLPNLFNVVAWLRIFIANEQTISRPEFYQMAVLELGTDHPGDMAQFAYLKPEISVVTAITPEHMEYFKTLDAVAAEELTVCDYSQQVLLNADDTPTKYLKGRSVLRYGLDTSYAFSASGFKPAGITHERIELHLQDSVKVPADIAIAGEQGVKIMLAAAATAQLAGLTASEITKGLKEVRPFAGRMQLLAGKKGSTIIDDTYNASPVAVKAGLDVLYATKAPQRIAILGNMNELGDYSKAAHIEVGKYCRSDKLDLVVTIGADAEKYLAPAARANGCDVQSFTSPYDAGEAVLSALKPGAVVLGEGSQNRVFAEEALKPLLAKKADESKLVRQSDDWMRIKRGQFQPKQ